MATLTALYTRLILDLNRDDMGSGGELEQAKVDAVADAVGKNQNELFWFNRASATISTTANTATVAIPTGMLIPQTITYLGLTIPKRDLADIQAVYNVTTPVKCLPQVWAEDGSNIHFYPTPDAVYSMAVYGIADLGVPSSGSSSNAWTTEAYDLTLNEAKIILCRGPLRDPDGLALAKDGRSEALADLRAETRRRGRVAAMTDIPVRPRFNINVG